MSSTIDGTAVAMIVESMAMRPVESITASRTGPRSERSPTLFSVTLQDYPTRAVTARPVGQERAGSRLFPAAPPAGTPADRALDHGRAVAGTATARDPERDESQRVHPAVLDRRTHRPAGGPQQ